MNKSGTTGKEEIKIEKTADNGNSTLTVGGIEISAKNFPDKVFRNYVVTNFDKDSDGVLSLDEINAVTAVDVSIDSDVTDLTGIEFFIRLRQLECHSTKIKKLNVSQNTSLKWLNCINTKIKKLDITKNTSLFELSCCYTEIKELDVSQNTSLNWLSCNNTKIKKLDISQNTSLRELSCSYTEIKELDVSQNTSLNWLSCDNTQIKELDVSQNTSLEYLCCDNTQIKELDVSQNTSLEYLCCDNIKIKGLNISQNTFFSDLCCSNTEMEELNTNNNSKTSIKSPLKKVEIITKQQIIDDFQETSPKTITGLPSGFVELDCMLSGLQPGHLIQIGSGRERGTSALALSIAQNVTCHKNNTTLIVSPDSSKEQIVNRLCLMENGVNDQQSCTAPLSELGWKDLTNGVIFNEKSHLIIDDKPGISVQELRCRCEKYKLKHNLGLVIIDYFELLSLGYEYIVPSRAVELSNIARSLKQLAEDLNIPIIVLSHLSRKCNFHGLPLLSDLRMSKDKNMDDIILIQSYLDCHLKNLENVELIIAKQKNGPTGIIKLKWLQDYIKFVNIKE